MVNFGPMRKNMGELIFGGVLDRHPKLKVLWKFLDPKIELRPREYWKRNCYATFINDPTGLALLPQLSADRVMWSSDYPHPVSSLGYEWTAISAVLDTVSGDDARMILGATAIEVFNLDR
jgi:predicted TIM-barrel fold metal-dependent hydrolase